MTAPRTHGRVKASPLNGDRYGALHQDLRRPAFAMVRRAFRGAFCEAEIEDIYSSAWLGTLGALGKRDEELSDDELRRYLLTAVANHASKELRRRGRRPTSPMDAARTASDSSVVTPDEQALDREETQVARDVLTSLPPRRRAVLALRYGWGLEPQEICGVVDGLSPRAYRREITRGVKELDEKLGAVESGEWCKSRAPLLRAYVGGVATADQARQAGSHLAHCRGCADYASKLSSALHDASGALVWTGAAAAIGGPRNGLIDIAADGLESVAVAGARIKERLPGFGADHGVELSAAQLAASGGARGAGAAGAGVLAQLAGLGVLGKATLACVGTGVAATACLASGVVPGVELPAGGADREPAKVRAVEPDPIRPVLPAPVSPEPAPEAEIRPEPADEPEPDPEVEQEPTEAQNAPVGTPAPAAPAGEHEFGLAGAAVSKASGGSSGSAGKSGSPTGRSGADKAAQEFGP